MRAQCQDLAVEEGYVFGLQDPVWIEICGVFLGISITLVNKNTHVKIYVVSLTIAVVNIAIFPYLLLLFMARQRALFCQYVLK
jgi:hypothetical protein